MKKLCAFALWCLLLSSVPSTAQDLPTRVQQMRVSYAGSGSIVLLDEHTLLIEPNMPGPMCALPRNDGGKTTWLFYAFNLASITVPLATVDESLIGEDMVFTDPAATKAYKTGDVGDTTMVIVAGVQGKLFQAQTYDRDKLAHLGPGPHDSSEYGQTHDNVEAFGLTFSDHASARAFEAALRDAVILAKEQARR
ncbi:MAG TPA: hypothetical protein VKR52_15710 [Terracidiphilus sp.]|nr:hypothetical protein [Terracidiphilus sp.]